MPLLRLSDLDRLNPRYLSEAQRRLRDGRYPVDTSLAGVDLPRLRIRRELSEAELAEGARLAREGASIRRIVRELSVTRSTAYGIYRDAKPKAPAPEPNRLEHAPTAAPEAERAPALVTPEPAPPAFDWAAARAQLKATR
jgi:hypothetical protein